MKWFFKRLAVLLIIFAGSLLIFSVILNRKHSFTDTKGMENASLPVMYMLYGDSEYNPMYGNAQLPEYETFRETVSFVPDDRNMYVRLYNNGTGIRGINYTVTSLLDGSVCEEGRVKHLTGDGNITEGDFHIERPFLMAQEFMLTFSVDTGLGEPYYYLTRIVSRSGQNLSWYLDYTLDFASRALSNTLTDEMKGQLEPTGAGVSSSFHAVDIHSPENMITWGSLAPEFTVAPTVKVLEINETTVSVELEYIVRSMNEDGAFEYFYVTEFYRMRKAQDQVILLDYNRKTDEYFDGELPVLTDDGINLGITGKDVHYKSGPDGNVTAFVKNRELWVYDREANKVTSAFSFSGKKSNFDLRTLKGSSDIIVSNVYENGDTDFILYGYMPTGIHEGRSGISVYRFDAADNTTGERIFIPVNESFAALSHSLKRLAYVNTAGELFVSVGDSIYSINVQSGTAEPLEENMDWDTFAVSDSQMIMSWMDSSGSIKLLNLENGNTSVIAPEPGWKLKALGFSGEDIIYGNAMYKNCYTDSVGNDFFLMSSIRISDFDGNTKLSYGKEGYYITGVERSEDVLIIRRAEKTIDSVAAAPDDEILFFTPEKESRVSMKLTVDDRKGTEVSLVYAGQGKKSNLLELYAGYTDSAAVPEAFVEIKKNEGECYYVYALGKLLDVRRKVNEAIGLADENVGVVLNRRQQYVWERGNVRTFVKLDYSSVPSGMFTASATESSVAQSIGKGYNTWNLTGCSLSSIRYQISSGYAVIGKWTSEQDLLIMGYDQYNIWIYDGETGELKAVAFDEAESQFAAMGNIFISYHI